MLITFLVEFYVVFHVYDIKNVNQHVQYQLLYLLTYDHVFLLLLFFFDNQHEKIHNRTFIKKKHERKKKKKRKRKIVYLKKLIILFSSSQVPGTCLKKKKKEKIKKIKISQTVPWKPKFTIFNDSLLCIQWCITTKLLPLLHNTSFILVNFSTFQCIFRKKFFHFIVQ